jgi:hypothetical protein
MLMCDKCKSTVSLREYEKNQGLCENCIEEIN